MISRLLILSLLALAGCGRDASSSERVAWESAPGFWVWHRAEALSADSIARLERAGGGPVYWQEAEIDADGRLRRTVPAGQAPGEEVDAIPVVRLAAGAATVEKGEAFEALGRWCVARYASTSAPRRLQVDYDCPAAALRVYAGRLERLREDHRIAELSVTALASWIDAPGFDALARATDELVPMFYDLEPDRPDEIRAGEPRPMVGEATVRWIRKWRDCPVSWRAGLPNFQRLSIFASDGSLVGHHQQWSPAMLRNHPHIETLSRAPGMRRFEVRIDGELSGVAIREDQQLVWRVPGETAIRSALAAARGAGAAGVVWFAHPASAPVAWRSVDHLAALGKPETPMADPRLQVDDAGRVVLTNAGTGDLVADLGESCHLVLESEHPGAFRPRGPGEFATVDGVSLARPELTRRIVLTFSSLPAGAAIRSARGLVNPTSAEPDWHLRRDP